MQMSPEDFQSQISTVTAKLAEYQDRSEAASLEAQLGVAREAVQFLARELFGTIAIAALLADRAEELQAALDTTLAQLAALRPASVV